MHQRDNEKLLKTLEDLRDLGNTLIVVEHDEDTMRATDAACLAANQIGENKAVIAYNDNGRTFVMYNPKLQSGIQRFTTIEECLSLDVPSTVERYKMIRVSYEILAGGKLEKRTRKFTGWSAQAVQHAIDHCEGKLV